MGTAPRIANRFANDVGGFTKSLFVGAGKQWAANARANWDMPPNPANEPSNDVERAGGTAFNAAGTAVSYAVVVSGGEGEGEGVSGGRVESEPSVGGPAAPKAALPKEGVYEGLDATAPGKTYVGQSGDISNRVAQHERSGKFAPGTEVSGLKSRVAKQHER